MSARSKTLQIVYHNSEDIRGLRTASIHGRTAKVFFFPRNLLKEASDELDKIQVGTYLLFGQSDEDLKLKVYIGESDSIRTRLAYHNGKTEKNFWTHTLVFYSSDPDFTKHHILFLENHFCSILKERFGCMLVTERTSETRIERSVADTLLDYVDSFQLLASALGFHSFEAEQKGHDENILVCKGPDAEGKGLYFENEFRVLQGSRIRKSRTDSLPSGVISKIDSLLTEGVLAEMGNSYQLNTDVTFRTPSGASSFVLGRNSNGWFEWKYARDGHTLSGVIRKESEQE